MTVTILLGTAQTHQEVAATVAQAVKEDITVRTHGVVRDKVQTTKEAAHMVAAAVVQEQVGHLVQEMDIEVLYECFGAHAKIVVQVLLHLQEHILTQIQVTYNRR